MADVLVCYYSVTGNTERMAKQIAKSIQKEGLAVSLKKAEDVQVDDLLGYKGIVIGSPTYYGSMAWPIKKLLDESVKHHTRLQGKIGGAFSSAANIGGGNETTIMNILNAMLIHGMIIQGDSQGDHYGPVSIGDPDSRVVEECTRFGRNIAGLIKKVSS